MTVGERIRKIRRDREMTQAYVAAQLNVTPPFISMIESGNSDPDSELLIKLAKVFGVSPAEFFVDATVVEAPARKHEEEGKVSDKKLYYSLPGHLSEEERERIGKLFEKLANIPPEDRELVYDLINMVFRRSGK